MCMYTRQSSISMLCLAGSMLLLAISGQAQQSSRPTLPDNGPERLAQNQFRQTKLLPKNATAHLPAAAANGTTILARTSGPVVETWAARYNGPDNNTDIARREAVDATGNVYVTGESYDSNGNTIGITTVKYSGATGQQLWAVRYTKPGFRENFARSIAVDAAGNVFVLGEPVNRAPRGNVIENDFVTIKYDGVTGQQLWEASYGGASNPFNTPRTLLLDAFGNPYVGGETGGGSVFVTLKYNGATGQQVWSSTYAGPGVTGPTAMALDAAGNAYVVGNFQNPDRTFGFIALKYDGATGLALLQVSNSGPVPRFLPGFVAVDARGDFYVAGSTATNSFGSVDLATVKYDGLTGQQRWVAIYPGVNFGNGPSDLALDGAGNPYVTGASYTPGSSSTSNTGFATIKYDGATGQQRWVARYDGPLNSSTNTPTALALDAAGNAYVTGIAYSTFDPSTGQNNADFTTFKYDGATGQQLWAAFYDGPAHSSDEARDVVLDAAGNVFVTGTSYNGSNYDYATVRYTQTPPVFTVPAIVVRLSSNVYTGGVATNLYLGYGPQSATLTASGGVRYAWSPATGLSNANSANPLFTAQLPGTYTFTVTVTNAAGYTATQRVVLTVIDVRCGNKNDKVSVCHAGQALCVASNAVSAHLANHGDQLGACGQSARLAPAVAAGSGSVALSAYPNPGSDLVMVSFRSPVTGPVQVVVCNELGQHVALLYEGVATGDQLYSFPFDSRGLAAGLYLCRLVHNGKAETQRLSIIR